MQHATILATHTSMCWSASSSVSSRSPCSPSHSFVCRIQQGLICARGIPIGGLLGSRHTLSTPAAQRCAPPDYFGRVTNPVSDPPKIVPSRASQPGSHTRGVQPSAARARPAGPYSHNYYSKSPVWPAPPGGRDRARYRDSILRRMLYICSQRSRAERLGPADSRCTPRSSRYL